MYVCIRENDKFDVSLAGIFLTIFWYFLYYLYFNRYNRNPLLVFLTQHIAIKILNTSSSNKTNESNRIVEV